MTLAQEMCVVEFIYVKAQSVLPTWEYEDTDHSNMVHPYHLALRDWIVHIVVGQLTAWDIVTIAWTAEVSV